MTGARDAVAAVRARGRPRAPRAQSLDDTIARFEAERAEAETA
jgi:chromosome segregation protein